MVDMSAIEGPCLLCWTIVSVKPSKYAGPSYFYFSGVGFGHPRLPSGVQFLTSSVPEIAEDCTWGRTRSRVYRLFGHLERDEFTEEIAEEVRVTLRQEFPLDFDVEYVSLEEWREVNKEPRQSTQSPD